jgi:putative ABC transport system ATP-binding protein
MLIVRDLEKTYPSGGRALAALRGVSFRIDPGEFVAIVGPSGSGKSTLLGLLAGLDRPTSGSVELSGADLGAMSEDARARLRREAVGFVFQSFQLIPTLTARENVQVPMELAGASGARERATELLDRVGLAGREHHYPAQLSGGEQQRVAIARAFVHGPTILFADEPTGNLDAATSMEIQKLILELSKETGKTFLIVTHDPNVAGMAHRQLRLVDGHFVDQK